MAEPDPNQGSLFGSGARQGKVTNSGGLSADVPHIKAMSDAVGVLTAAMSQLSSVMGSFKGDRTAAEYDKITASIKKTATAVSALDTSMSAASAASKTSMPVATPFGGTNNHAAATTAPVTAVSASMPPPPNNPPNNPPGGGGGPPSGPTGPVSTMTSTYSNAGGGMSGALAAATSGALSALNSAAQVMGAITGAGVQYVNNRIEGPTGNRAATMQMSQALAPLATMMGRTIQDTIKGFAQRTPVQGSQSDILSTALAGNDVGAQLRGTPGRNGFFQGVREMQALTPGIGAAQLSNTFANYMKSTKSQQMGIMYGGGAFTTMGTGGRYKSLGEWAVGITKFLEQQRPGGQRGKPFTTADLLAQNFPGSNFNAWFQMMGVPDDMVSYWWQYVMTKAQSGTSADTPFGGETGLATAVKKQRGNDLGAQRLDTVTQSSRRDFLMGTQMYPAYGVKEAADKRFNVAMQKADLDIGQMATQTRVGQIMSQLPTTISDLIMPLLTKLAGSKAGGVLGTLDMLGVPLTGDPIGDPIGDYGSLGGTSTRSLAPGLAKGVSAMMRANPAIKITSGMRDTSTQNRLHKAGVGRVGPATRSKHTRGWAADLGPVSQLGWINANAHKYGLQTAHNQGEPWHVQQAGTMPVGDVGGIVSDVAGAAGSVVGAAKDVVGGFYDVLTDPGGLIRKVLDALIGKGGTDTSGDIDKAIQMFMKVLLTPTFALADTFGKANPLTAKGADAIINDPHNLTVDYRKYAGFTPSKDPGAGNTVFGDPPITTLSKFTSTRSLPRIAPSMHSVQQAPNINIVNHFNVSGDNGNGQFDTRRTAAVLASHVETELQRRLESVR